MWPRDAASCEFPLSWREALDHVRAWNVTRQLGYGDWKLPNRRELFSMVSHDAINPCLVQGHPFINVFPGYYWTSTSCARLPDQAWYIHLGGARVFKGMKHGSYMTWPVRVAHAIAGAVRQTGQRQCYDEKGIAVDCRGTGQDGEYHAALKSPGPRYAQNGNTVYDRDSGLTWSKNANHFGAMTDWHAARDLVREINRKGQWGYDDWRMPTILELESLIDLGEHSPALSTGHPFIDVRDHYWSSTTSRYDTGYAWALYLQDGILGVGHKPLAEFHLWPVRGSAGRNPG